MTAKLHTYAKVEDFQAVAKRIVEGHGRVRGLMQEATIAAIEHIGKHGNINVALPLASASSHFGRNLSSLWIGYITAHTSLVYNAKGLRGRALTNAKVEDLWSWDAKRKAGEVNIDGAKAINWWDYKKPAAERESTNVNAPDAIARFVKRMQQAIEAGTIVGADDKPLSFATVVKMLHEQIDTLKPKDIVAGRVDAKAETNVGTPVKRAVRKGKNVEAQKVETEQPKVAAAA